MQFSLYCHLIATIVFGILYLVIYPSYSTIPLVVFSLSIFAYCENNRYATYIASGLLFSGFGDICLRLDSENGNFFLFLGGIVNYLIAHLFYIRAYYSSDIDFSKRIVVGGIFMAYCGVMLGILCPGVEAALIPAVIVYAMIICTMTFLATNRFFTTGIGSTSRVNALCGSLIFLSSDTLLSLNRFRTPIPQADVIICVTYYLGQMLIAMSAKDPFHTADPQNITESENILLDIATPLIAAPVDGEVKSRRI